MNPDPSNPTVFLGLMRSSGHPFFERMGVLRAFFLEMEDREHSWRGELQDRTVESQLLESNHVPGDYKLALAEDHEKTDQMAMMLRL